MNNCIKSIKDFIDIKSISQLKSYMNNCIKSIKDFIDIKSISQLKSYMK